jgi:hexosaminidase
MKRNLTKPSAALLLTLATFTMPIHAAEPSLIPAPSSVKLSENTANLADFTQIDADEKLTFEKNYLQNILTDWKKMAGKSDSKTSAKTIKLSMGTVKSGSDYTLKIGRNEISIHAKDHASVFYGIQTLLQLVKLHDGQADMNIATGVIQDSARFNWRGLMLDSSRHFQSVQEIKEFIDLMARYKLNMFHWHLTDDQGWRIEIKSRPKLTSVGAWRVPRTGIWWFRPGPLKGEKPTYGGFYTQEQIKDIVAYASERHISIIPEIDVPGHSLAILAAYPELSTTGGPFKVNPGSKFHNQIENTLDPSNPETYKFMDDVFTEVAALFPHPYIHVGGDECTKKFWMADPDCKKFMQDNQLKNGDELQAYFINRMEKILQKNGKKLIGWDEILDGGLSKSATVMSWRGTRGGDKAAKAGRKIVIASNSAYYFDLYQGHAEYEPATYAKLRLKKSYLFDYSVPKGADPKLLLGLHGCLWTESVANQRHAQYMLWPRALALAETAWSTNTQKDWPGFVKRVESHFERFDFMDINYAKSIYDPTVKLTKKNKREIITLGTEIDGLDIHYTFDTGEVDHHYPVYKGPLTVPYGATTIRFRTYRDNQPVGKLRTAIIAKINKK